MYLKFENSLLMKICTTTRMTNTASPASIGFPILCQRIAITATARTGPTNKNGRSVTHWKDGIQINDARLLKNVTTYKQLSNHILLLAPTCL